jgi:hypothetical protein
VPASVRNFDAVTSPVSSKLSASPTSTQAVNNPSESRGIDSVPSSTDSDDDDDEEDSEEELEDEIDIDDIDIDDDEDEGGDTNGDDKDKDDEMGPQRQDQPRKMDVIQDAKKDEVDSKKDWEDDDDDDGYDTDDFEENSDDPDFVPRPKVIQLVGYEETPITKQQVEQIVLQIFARLGISP